MDPQANLREQLELSADILVGLGVHGADDGTVPADAAQAIVDKAGRLAELVGALHEWREAGGFDPYPLPAAV